MASTVTIIRTFLNRASGRAAIDSDLRTALDAVLGTDAFARMLAHVVAADVFSVAFGEEFSRARVARALGAARTLRTAPNMAMTRLFQTIADLATALEERADVWAGFAARVRASFEYGDVRLATFLARDLADAGRRTFYEAFVARTLAEHPHAMYPTSEYRECEGHVFASDDDRAIDAVMTLRTSASIRLVDRVLDHDRTELRDAYRVHGRCVCVIDETVDALYGDRLASYFDTHGIVLEKRIYRAMESDKGLATVERMLGDFKMLGVSRNEPVLVVGGGVLADTGGLACALYGRNTPYVMLATSIVSGIDAGPSPRTCCDGFGYKNLLGAYHPPVLCLTDRFFFATLQEGWLRHGIAEIAKIAIVTNANLVAELEAAGPELIRTRFGTVDCATDAPIVRRSQRILAGAMRSYVASEYGNLYETHQCRPHAFGHTWSPGFEIEAGLLHGHAVSIDMGLSAYLALREGWIDVASFERILALFETFGLSLWHDVLEDERTMWASHRKIVEKRGGNLVAPLPRGAIGECGYLNDLSRTTFLAALDAYRTLCATRANGGRGIEPLCSDVGLQHPATV